MTAVESPDIIYGRLLESAHLAGVGVTRMGDWLETLLDGEGWQKVGPGFTDVNAFLRSIDLSAFDLGDRKRLHKRIKELQPEASTRAISQATGSPQSTVARHVSDSDPIGSPEPNDSPTDQGVSNTSDPIGSPESDDGSLFAPGEQEAILDQLHEAHGDDLTAEQIEQAVDENVESKRLPEWQPTKPDLGDGISHPARYSPELIDLFAELLGAYSHPGARVLDPFAGTGRIHDLHPEFDTVGIELEPEWARLNPRTQIGSALNLPFDPGAFDAIITSPTYGNRLADSHDASDPERRRSYTHDLGRDLSEENSGDMHWRTTNPGAGAMGSFDYRNFHALAWIQAIQALGPSGLFILNLCDHVRDGLVQPVTAWHTWCLGRLGLEWVESRSVPTRKLRQGANGNLREQEQVHVFRKFL